MAENLSADEVREMLRHVPSRPDYEAWTRVISAVGAALPVEEAAVVLNEWSPEERRGEYAEKLRNRLKTVGVATLVWMASEGGYDAKEAARRRRCGAVRGGAGVASSPPRPAPRPAPSPEPARPAIKWPRDMHAGSAAELEALAGLRGLPCIDGLAAATGEEHLWFCTLRDLDGEGRWVPRPAWLLTDRARKIALARRMDGEPWRCTGNKGWMLRGSQGNWAIGAADIGDAPEVWLTEGGPDFLCAWHYIDGQMEFAAPVCAPSASGGIPCELLPCFAGRLVRVFPHGDEAGMRALRAWTGQLREAGAAEVLWFDISEFLDSSGASPKDLNEYLLADAGGRLSFIAKNEQVT
jgi:hypothetical protein